jgi:membrane protease YdiL (CAAX protease family)
VVNNSTSTISPVWPTRWPADSFRFLPTFAVVCGAVGISIAVLIAGIVWLFATHSLVSRAGNVPLVPALVIQLVIEIGVVWLILAKLPKLSGFSLRDLGFTMPRLSTIATAIGGAIAMAIVVNGAATLIETIMHQKHDQKVVEMFKQIHDPGTVAFFAIFAIVLAPFAEETMFRIFTFNIGLRYRGFWFGAVLSALLFGIAHGDLVAAFPLALGGLVLCAVYYRTQNAFASMITHGLFNSLTVLALLYAPNLAK